MLVDGTAGKDVAPPSLESSSSVMSRDGRERRQGLAGCTCDGDAGILPVRQAQGRRVVPTGGFGCRARSNIQHANIVQLPVNVLVEIKIHQ